MLKTLVVLVPKPETRAAAMIDAGSGIVYDPTAPSNGRVLVYFEGNRYGAANLTTFALRVACAAGRLDQRYPTVAKGMLMLEDFHQVGEYVYAQDWSSTVLTLHGGGAEMVAAWLDGRS